MYLPEEVVLRVNKIEGDMVFMGPKYRCLRLLWSGKKGYPFRIDHVENEQGLFKKVRKEFSVQKSIIETVVEERIFVAYYNDPKERANVRYEFKLSNPCEDPMMRKYIETHIDELIYMLPGGGITFMYNPDDNRTVGYITRIE